MVATAGTRLVELPGRGVTRVWECPGPRGAGTLMLIHGVTFTAELNWEKVFAPLAPHFRVVAMDLRGHGDGISAGGRFRLGDCADDIPALAQGPGSGRGGAVPRARRAPPPTRWNPSLQPMSAELLGMALMGPLEDPATARLARAQLRRTSLGTAISAIQAVCEFTSHSWIGQVDVPTAVVVTARDHVVPVSRQLRLARAIPGASVHDVDADHAVCVTRPQLFTQSLLQACWSVTAARADGTQPGLTGTML